MTILEQYVIPEEEEGWRILGMMENIQDGDEVWNFHFKSWVEFHLVDRSWHGYIENHRHSPRLCIIRRRADLIHRCSVCGRYSDTELYCDEHCKFEYEIEQMNDTRRT